MYIEKQNLFINNQHLNNFIDKIYHLNFMNAIKIVVYELFFFYLVASFKMPTLYAFYILFLILKK